MKTPADISTNPEQNHALSPYPHEDMVITEQEHRAWERVQKVLQAWQRGAMNTKQACEMAGVTRGTYYEDIKASFVQARLLEQTRGLAAATQEVIEHEWLPVVRNMIKVARSDSRENVAAARFLDKVYGDIKAASEALEEGKDEEAATFLQQFASMPESTGTRKVTVRKKGKHTDIEASLEIPPGTEG